MQRLRHAHAIARLVLMWFALSLGAAVASPMVKAQALDLVCSSAGGVKLLGLGDDRSSPGSGHMLDCPLCASIGAPPPMQMPGGAMARPVFRTAEPLPAVQIAAIAGAPLPARGPPASLAIQ